MFAKFYVGCKIIKVEFVKAGPDGKISEVEKEEWI